MHPILGEPLSPSRLSAFEKCQLQFRYKYIDKLPEPPSLAAFRGNVVHTVLEQLLTLPSGERSLDAAFDLVDAAIDANLEAQPQAVSVIDPTLPDLTATPNPEKVREFRGQVSDLVSRYFNLENPADVSVLALERYVKADPIAGVQIHGYIDRLDRNPAGETVVVDYKTGKAPRPQYEEQYWPQLMLYALVLRSLGERVSELKLHFLGGEPRTIRRRIEDADLESASHALRYQVTRLQRAVNTRDFSTKRGPLCNYCNFQAYCPEFAGTTLPPPY